jgi:DNA-binding MarR family transcriptional regulator
LKLQRLTRIVTRHYDVYVAATGLRSTQYSLLSEVVALGPIRPGDLARHMGVDASTLTRNLRPLVTHGWLQLSPGDDARSRLVDVTDHGRAKHTEAQRAWKKAQLALEARLGSQRVAALNALLDECIECLDDPTLGSACRVARDASEMRGPGSHAAKQQ